MSSIDEARQFVHVYARHNGPRHDTCDSCARMRNNEVTSAEYAGSSARQHLADVPASVQPPGRAGKRHLKSVSNEEQLP